MLILLPPSETKAPGGDGPALDVDALLFPQLRAIRLDLLRALRALGRDLPAARAALKVGPAKDDEVAANARLLTAPTRPALERYTGVLYDALDVAGMKATERARAEARIVVASALFGALRATDAIPAYRLSAGSRLPGRPSLAHRWRPDLQPALATLARSHGPVLDLRSGAYAAFGAVPGAITVRVLTEMPDGSRQVVSHFNKATKGLLARRLATSRARLESVDDIARVARRAGHRVERTGETALAIVTDPR